MRVPRSTTATTTGNARRAGLGWLWLPLVVCFGFLYVPILVLVAMSFNDGGSAQVPFRVSHDPKDRGGYGPGVYFGSDLYQKTGAGDC